MSTALLALILMFQCGDVLGAGPGEHVSGESAAASVPAEAVRMIPGLAWPVLLFVLIIWYRDVVRKFADALVWRGRVGAPLRIGGLQLDKLNVTITRSTDGIDTLLKHEKDRGEFTFMRRKALRDQRGIFLVHQITPSLESDQLYDASIYLVAYDPEDTPSPGASLVSVK